VRKILLPIVATVVIGAGAPSAQLHTPEAQAKLDKALEGRVAGEPEKCLRPDKTSNPIGIDDSTILFRDGPRIWRNELQSGFQCGDLRGRKALVTVGMGRRTCRGDTLQVVDLNLGQMIGTCVLGDFVPYTKPKN
jgi:hypothetical protein